MNRNLNSIKLSISVSFIISFDIYLEFYNFLIFTYIKVVLKEVNMIKKILATVTIISTLVGSSFNSFAFTTSHPYVKLISGDTGRTYTWQTPTGTEITMPIIRKDAVISLKEGQSFHAYFYGATGKLTKRNIMTILIKI